MRTARRVLCVAGIATVVAGSLAAAGPADLPMQAVSSGERRGPLGQYGRQAPARPFARLFQVPPLSPSRAPGPAPRALPSTPPAPARPGPRTVCGMVVIPVDPAVDAGILAGRPRGDTRYSMRVITPPACQ